MEKHYKFSLHELVYGKSVDFPIEFEIKTLRTTLDVDLDLMEALIGENQ